MDTYDEHLQELYSTIAEKQLGVAPILEQTAEECVELAHALLKFARKLRNENPTPTEFPDLFNKMDEETADVEVCIDILRRCVIRTPEVEKTKIEKVIRWKKRLEEREEN